MLPSMELIILKYSVPSTLSPRDPFVLFGQTFDVSPVSHSIFVLAKQTKFALHYIFNIVEKTRKAQQCAVTGADLRRGRGGKFGVNRSKEL